MTTPSRTPLATKAALLAEAETARAAEEAAASTAASAASAAAAAQGTANTAQAGAAAANAALPGKADLDAGTGLVVAAQLPADLARTSDVDQRVADAIAVLVGTAPAALDTLQELATALANDADFAASVTVALSERATVSALQLATDRISSLEIQTTATDSALAAETTARTSADTALDERLDTVEGALPSKAPLASPALTGTPTAPTVPATTDSTQLATTAFVQAAKKLVTIPADKTADYTLVLADAGSSIGVDSASARALTVPPNSSVAFPVGTLVEVRQVGAGQVTLTAGAGVTLRSAGGALKVRAQYGAVSLLKVAADTWSVQGDVIT